MYNGKRIIDVHGRMSAPSQFRAYESTLIHKQDYAGFGSQFSDEAMDKAA